MGSGRFFWTALYLFDLNNHLGKPLEILNIYTCQKNKMELFEKITAESFKLLLQKLHLWCLTTSWICCCLQLSVLGTQQVIYHSNKWRNKNGIAATMMQHYLTLYFLGGVHWFIWPDNGIEMSTLGNEMWYLFSFFSPCS